jgi:hypothetical protein
LLVLRIQDYNTRQPINLIIVRLYNEKSQLEYSASRRKPHATSKCKKMPFARSV